MIFDRYANLKYKYGNRYFWCGGYYVETEGKMKKNRGICKESDTRRFENRSNYIEGIYYYSSM